MRTSIFAGLKGEGLRAAAARNANPFGKICVAKAKHAYDLDVKINLVALGEVKRGELRVEANNRTQAASLARLQGFEVLSVNMVG